MPVPASECDCEHMINELARLFAKAFAAEHPELFQTPGASQQDGAYSEKLPGTDRQSSADKR